MTNNATNGKPRLSGPRSLMKFGPKIAKPNPSSVEVVPTTTTDVVSTEGSRSRPPATSPISSVPRPSMLMVASSVLAEIAAAASPTAAGGAVRAASDQNTNPKPDVTAAVADRVLTLLTMVPTPVCRISSRVRNDPCLAYLPTTLTTWLLQACLTRTECSTCCHKREVASATASKLRCASTVRRAAL